MTSVKSLAARFYERKCGHAHNGTYLKRYGHRGDQKCWWCKRVAQTQEHIYCHFSRWKNEQNGGGKRLDRRRARKREDVQISELFSIAKCDQSVMDFLAATDDGEFPPK